MTNIPELPKYRLESLQNKLDLGVAEIKGSQQGVFGAWLGQRFWIVQDNETNSTFYVPVWQSLDWGRYLEEK